MENPNCPIIYLMYIYSLKAIHNKDYSVVKTFKPPHLSMWGIFLFKRFHIISPS